MLAWVNIPWNQAVFNGGLRNIIIEYASSIEQTTYQIEGDLNAGAFSHGRAALVALSDPRLWAIDAFFRGAVPVQGVQPIAERSQLPDFGPAYETVDRLSTIGDGLFNQLSFLWRQEEHSMEKAVIKALLETRPGSFVWADTPWSAPVNIYNGDDDRVAGSIAWELSLFTTPMMTRVADVLIELLANAPRMYNDEAPFRPDNPEPFLYLDHLRYFIELAPEDIHEDGSGHTHELDEALRVLPDALATLLPLLIANLERREQIRRRAPFEQSNAASTFLHRASANRMAVHSDRQGRDLTGVIGSFVSQAITPAAPVPTRPISNAQRLIEISREAQNAAVRAAANPAAAANALRELSRKISQLNDSVEEESNKRQRHQ